MVCYGECRVDLTAFNKEEIFILDRSFDRSRSPLSSKTGAKMSNAWVRIWSND